MSKKTYSPNSTRSVSWFIAHTAALPPLSMSPLNTTCPQLTSCVKMQSFEDELFFKSNHFNKPTTAIEMNMIIT